MTDGRTSQARRDARRRNFQFGVRLESELRAQLRHYADKRHDGIINPALQTIILKFFNGK